jgi:hypothetical protein
MGSVKVQALVDTGAFSSAISLFEFNKIRSQKPDNPVTKLEKVLNEVVRVANGTPARIMFRAIIKMQFAGQTLNEKFVVIDKLNSAILGIPFFRNNGILIDLAKKRLKCPDFTLQINQIVHKDGSPKKVYPKNMFPVATISKHVIEPNEQVVIFCKIDANKEKDTNLSGIIEPSIPFEKRTELCVTSSLSKSDERGYFPVGILNLSRSVCTIPANTVVEKLKFLTPQQVQFLTPIDPKVLDTVKRHSESKSELSRSLTAIYGLDASAHSKNQLNLLEEPIIGKREFWFPTPETCKNPEKLNDIEREIYNTILKFKELEKINPHDSEEFRQMFLKNFDWKDSALEENEKKQAEELLVKFQDIFGRHRLDVGYNTEFKVKLTPEDKRPVYTKGPPTPIHLRKEILVELALMQY